MASRIAEKLAAKKAAIYIRVSTHWQVDKDSLKVQRRELTAYCEMVLGITDYVIFEDPGYSAKNTDRPEYQAMMDRVRSGEFTHIVVWKIDRISRNYHRVRETAFSKQIAKPLLQIHFQWTPLFSCLSPSG